MNRYINILILTISTIIFVAVSNSYAQTPLVPIPNPDWPLDSVVNGSVHFYTVPGDRNYTKPSSFVWTVEGGRLFQDQALTTMAGDGAVATVIGDNSNTTRLWVIWDSFDTPLDTGYIYVYEISADGCMLSDSLARKFQGMRIKVSAPPEARFMRDQTVACSNLDSARVIIEIKGMPPYDLVYSLNGVQRNWHINPADLSDLDGDGEANNVSFFYSGLDTVTSDATYMYQLDNVSSGGVFGKILYPATHDLFVHVQPPAPVIGHEWTEVTIGSTHTYYLDNPGVNAEEWYWTFRDINTNMINNFNSKTQSSFELTFLNTLNRGWYSIDAQYRDKPFGCYSPFDSMNIELFDIPTIAFSDSSEDIINCSATTLVPGETFDFMVEYTGARTYGFTYVVYDYNDVAVDGGVFDNLTNRTNIISIKNNFINDALPEQSRPWKVVITEAHNKDSNVKIIGSEIVDGGKDERIIMIYPKPIILDDIDFAN